jgi:hypothetical protein
MNKIFQDENVVVEDKSFPFILINPVNPVHSPYFTKPVLNAIQSSEARVTVGMSRMKEGR